MQEKGLGLVTCYVAETPEGSPPKEGPGEGRECGALASADRRVLRNPHSPPSPRPHHDPLGSDLLPTDILQQFPSLHFTQIQHRTPCLNHIPLPFVSRDTNVITPSSCFWKVPPGKLKCFIVCSHHFPFTCPLPQLRVGHSPNFGQRDFISGTLGKVFLHEKQRNRKCKPADRKDACQTWTRKSRLRLPSYRGGLLHLEDPL